MRQVQIVHAISLPLSGVQIDQKSPAIQHNPSYKRNVKTSVF